MNKMNRRQFLKTVSFVSTGAIVTGVAFGKMESNTWSFFLVTDQPDADIARLTKIIGRKRMNAARVETSPIAEANQDLSYIQNGQLQDPTKSNSLNSGMISLARKMRSRQAGGHFIVTIDLQGKRNSNLVEFELDGEIIERIPVQRNYQDITIPGEYGTTSFKLNDKTLSVTEAGCKHELCKKMGNIRAGRIVCAPNKLVATINGQSNRLDGITG